MGLTGSVVEGVLSAEEMEAKCFSCHSRRFGNSGGPILDRQGRVHGIMTMKSTVTANLGFAMPAGPPETIDHQAEPVPMDRWLTIGALNGKEWEP